MSNDEITRLRVLLSALPDSELRDLGLLAVSELLEQRSRWQALGEAIKEAGKA